MKIHTFHSEPHYREHTTAIWKHLPDELRGSRFMNPRLIDQHTHPDDVVMVAGFNDVGEVLNRALVYVEHGAGQRYVGIKPQYELRYHGSKHPNRVIAYISPRQEVADSWGRPAFAAGSPVCDPYQLFGEEGVVAITFHYDAPQICPELRSAFWHYGDRMPEIVAALKREGYEVLAHRHPRFDHMSSAWRHIGVPEVDVDTVRRRASILIADNTSLMYEMLYLFRKVVTLNAPWYRRDVEHGLRFWEHMPGIPVGEPSELLNQIEDHFPYLGSTTTSNEITARCVYGRPMSDGEDGFRAATWLTAHLAGA